MHFWFLPDNYLEFLGSYQLQIRIPVEGQRVLFEGRRLVHSLTVKECALGEEDAVDIGKQINFRIS